MKNHLHLQVEDSASQSQGGHAKVAQWYVVRFNVRHRRSGPFSRGAIGRFSLASTEWITEVNRYIHLNPVRMKSRDLGKRRQAEMRRGIEDTPDEGLVRERLKNCANIHGVRIVLMQDTYISGPKELQTADVLGCFEGRSQQQQRKSSEYTESAIREGLESEGLLYLVRYGVLLGGEEWTAKLRLLLDGDRREQPALHAAAKQDVSFDAVAAASRGGV